MTTQEFLVLANSTGLNKKDLQTILGISQGTIYNYFEGGRIPKSKELLIRTTLTKSKQDLLDMLNGVKNLNENDVIEYALKHFDKLMGNQDFRTKVYIEAYNMAKGIIETKE
jgi:hypothetical protein